VLSALLRKYSQVFQSAWLGTSPREVYAQRRRVLLDNLSSVCVFAGVERIPGSEESWSYNYDRHIQDPAFLYLTGINQPGCLLVLDPLAPKGSAHEILFLPPKRSEREFWDGAMLGVPKDDDAVVLQEMRDLTGFSDIRSAKDFHAWIRDRVTHLRRNHLFAYWHEYVDAQSQELRQGQNDHNWELRVRLQKLLKQNAPQVQLRTVAPLHMHHRIPLDAKRVHMARTAQTWTRDAFIETLQELPKLRNERDVRLLLEYKLQRQSDDGLAFPTIVASGDNACTLHYVKDDEPLQPGRLLLLDFGVRCGSLCSDISRTIPQGGRFNPLQRLLYQIVLDTQKYHQAAVKPGKTLRELNRAAWEHLELLLTTRFLSKGGHMRRQYPLRPESKGPHGISHLIGEQVHEGDAFRVYQDQPLRPGMMISNEPGLYGFFQAEFEGKVYAETIGIRIEDDLLVTSRGCSNLSAQIPKEVEDLELILTH